MSFSSLSILTAWLLGLVVFILSFKEKSPLHKSSLRQWAVAFLLFSLYRIPAALFNLGIDLKFISLTAIYAVTFPLAVIAYLLFYRGVAILITQKKFWINKLPVIVFAVFISLIFSLRFLFEIPAATLMGIVRFFNYSIILLIIAVATKALKQKPPILAPFIARIGVVLVVFGWILLFISDLYIWQTAKTYVHQLWFVSLINVPYAYLGFTIAQLLILVGIILVSYHTETPPGKYKKYTLVAGLSALILFGLVGVLNPPENQKADILLLPKDNTTALVGQNFETIVGINTQNPINAVEASISYSADSLEAVGISKNDSILNFWIEEPSFSNASGTIRFAGVLHDGQTGFQGNGEILTITFKPKKIGEAKIDFTNAEILASDGEGTNITGNKKGVVYSVIDNKPATYDFNSDGKIGITDLSILIFNFGSTNAPQYDLNNDGKVGLTDLSILISRMGR